MRLEGKVSIITGAGRGIGFATVKKFLAEGSTVIACDIDPSFIEKLSTVFTNDSNGTALVVDVTDPKGVVNMVNATVTKYGRIDVLVNNAGVTRAADIMELTEADWDKIHRVNAKGVFFCLQNAAKQMIEQGNGGRIINIASIAGRGFSGTSNAAYSASKGAVISLTKTAAQQLARHDITVNSICPGVTTTEIVEGLVKTRAEAKGISIEAMVKEMTDNIPLKRANEPEDIAAMAIFLASSGARNITGQSYNVDGGLVTS